MSLSDLKTYLNGIVRVSPLVQCSVAMCSHLTWLSEYSSSSLSPKRVPSFQKSCVSLQYDDVTGRTAVSSSLSSNLPLFPYTKCHSPNSPPSNFRPFCPRTLELVSGYIIFFFSLHDLTQTHIYFHPFFAGYSIGRNMTRSLSSKHTLSHPNT